LIRTSASAVALSALAIAAGCGGPAYEYDSTVTGKVTVDGELAKSGTVTFHPADEGGKPAIGHIHSDGSYSLRTGQGDLGEADGGTVVSGDYIVTVMVAGPSVEDDRSKAGGPPTPGPSLVHSKYASKDTSDLNQAVEPGSQVINLELDAAEVVEPEDEAKTDGAAEGEAPVDASVPPAETAPPSEHSSEPPAETQPPSAATPDTPADPSEPTDPAAPAPDASSEEPTK
jgi:hypothetical protein